MLNSMLSEKIKINIANKNTSKKSSPNIEDNKLTTSNYSKTTESKISKISQTDKGSITKVGGTKNNKSSKIFAKKVVQSMMRMSQTIHQTI